MWDVERQIDKDDWVSDLSLLFDDPSDAQSLAIFLTSSTKASHRVVPSKWKRNMQSNHLILETV